MRKSRKQEYPTAYAELACVREARATREVYERLLLRRYACGFSVYFLLQLVVNIVRHKPVLPPEFPTATLFIALTCWMLPVVPKIKSKSLSLFSLGLLLVTLGGVAFVLESLFRNLVSHF
jgi:hypothetical protein